MLRMVPLPSQLKPGTMSGAVSPPVRTSAMPETMDIMPSVTMSGFMRSRVVNRIPLTPPIAPATTQASTDGEPDIQASAVEQRDQHAGKRPAMAATERSSPPAMISGVPARRHQSHEGDVGADR